MQTAKWKIVIEGEGPIGNDKNWDVDRRAKEFETKLKNDGHKVTKCEQTSDLAPKKSKDEKPDKPEGDK